MTLSCLFLLIIWNIIFSSAKLDVFNYVYRVERCLNIVLVVCKSKILSTYHVFVRVSIIAAEYISQQGHLTISFVVLYLRQIKSK
jgi:hypothetical protein